MAGIGVVWSGSIGRNGLELCGGTLLNPNDIGGFTACSQALVVGILLHVGTTVLFEAGDGHGFHAKKMMAILIGLGLSTWVFL